MRSFSDRFAKLILAVAISALVLGGTALVLGLAAYSDNSSTVSNTRPATPVSTAPETKGIENGDSRIQLQDNNLSERTFDTASSNKCEGLTGNLTVYLILMTKSTYFNSAAILDSINNKVGSIEAAVCGINYGASKEGQEVYEKVTLTQQNMTPDLKADGFKVGDIVEMRVIKKPAETVKFYIDPAIKKRDGSPLTTQDIAQDYSFGNGAICCGITLADGTSIRGVAVIVVDEAYNAAMVEQFPSIKSETNSKIGVNSTYTNETTVSNSNNGTAVMGQSLPSSIIITPTGNLSVYIIPTKAGVDAAKAITTLQSFVFKLEAFHFTDLEASPQGQYGYENATIT